MIYRFGTFEFDPASGQLSKAGRRVRLEPQPGRLLAVLVARPGEIVTRDELKRQIWTDGTHVDFDRGLAFCLAQVRTALGDAAENPRFVETLPRRGVRFIAPVAVSESDAHATATPASSPALEAPGAVSPVAPRDGESARAALAPPAPASAQSRRTWRVLAASLVAIALVVAAAAAAWVLVRQRGSAPGRPIVAVAVFDNETGRRELDALAAQTPDVIVARLLSIDPAHVGVIGNSRVLRVPRSERDLRAIARDTAATFVVLGQVQNDERDAVRVIVHLIRLADGTHVWAHRVVRASDNLAQLEETIAAAVEQAIRTRVLRDTPPSGSSPTPATR